MAEGKVQTAADHGNLAACDNYGLGLRHGGAVSIDMKRAGQNNTVSQYNYVFFTGGK
jgi:hypothetical protein